VPKIYTGKKTASSTNDVGKTIYSHVEGWSWTPISHLVQDDRLKMDQRPSSKTQNLEMTTGKHKRNLQI
jgi:hypothetical protein